MCIYIYRERERDARLVETSGNIPRAPPAPDPVTAARRRAHVPEWTRSGHVWEVLIQVS